MIKERECSLESQKQLYQNCGWELIGRADEWCYLGQWVYHITHCVRCWRSGLGTIEKWRLRVAGHEVERKKWFYSNSNYLPVCISNMNILFKRLLKNCLEKCVQEPFKIRFFYFLANKLKLRHLLLNKVYLTKTLPNAEKPKQKNVLCVPRTDQVINQVKTPKAHSWYFGPDLYAVFTS